MTIKEEGLIIFFNTHEAIKAESKAKNIDSSAGLIPVLPIISAGCGFMLKIEWSRFTEVVNLLEKEKINYKGLYYSKKTGLKREVELLYSKEQ